MSSPPTAAAQNRPRRGSKAVERFDPPPQATGSAKKRRKQAIVEVPAPIPIDKEVACTAELIYLVESTAGSKHPLPQAHIRNWNRMEPLLFAGSEKAMLIIEASEREKYRSIEEVAARLQELCDEWASLPAERYQRYLDLAVARTTCLKEDPDLLMQCFLQLPKIKKREGWARAGCPTPLKAYAACAGVCKYWNAVLQGKRPGLEVNAQILFGRLLETVSTPEWMRYTSNQPSILNGKTITIGSEGYMPRPGFMNALCLSTHRSNIIGAQMPLFFSMNEHQTYVFPMPAAYNAAMESEGGWAGLLKRRALKAKRAIDTEHRKAVAHVGEQRATLKLLQKHMTATGLLSMSNWADAVGKGEDVDNLGDATFWHAIEKCAPLFDALRKKQTARVDLARQRGGGHKAAAVAYEAAMTKAAEQAELGHTAGAGTSAEGAEADGDEEPQPAPQPLLHNPFVHFG